MKAIVTGGLGFIGSHLVDALVARGDRVLVIDDGRTSRGEYTWGPDVRVIRVSVGNVDDWDVLNEADIVYHLASPVGPVGVLDEAGRITPQIIGDCNTVARWADRVVFVSTSEVYGGGLNCSEQDPRVVAAGHSARLEYQTAKLAAETMLLNMGIDVRIVRPFNVAGPRQSTRGGFVLPRFVAQALRGELLTVYAPGSQRRAFTHVADIVAGILAAGDKGTPGDVYNLGNPANTMMIADLAQAVIRDVARRRHQDGPVGAWRLVDPTAIWGSGFAEAADKLPDPTKAMNELGWKPTRDRAEIIVDTVDFMAQPGMLERYA